MLQALAEASPTPNPIAPCCLSHARGFTGACRLVLPHHRPIPDM